MRVALVQMTSSDTPEDNIGEVTEAISYAAGGNADWVITPEVTNCVSASRTHQADVLRLEIEDQTLSAAQNAAKNSHVSVCLGSLALKSDASGAAPFVNRSFLIDHSGSVTARYDKIHMFDVDISETESYRESAGYRPGERAVVGSVAGVPVGLSICYDLRFPQLFRALARKGAKIVTVPSAFSPETGAAHWEVLLRARAIENSCYIIAPAQTGTHDVCAGRARKTYGHSMVIDPWGRVTLDAGTEKGVFFADIDLDLVDDCRRRIPSLSHGRDFEGP